MLNPVDRQISQTSDEHFLPRIGKKLYLLQRRSISIIGMSIMGVMLLLVGCLAPPRAVYRPDIQIKPRMTATEARQIIVGKMQGAYNSCWNRAPYQNVQATMKGFSFFNPGGVPAANARAVPPQTRYIEYQNIKNVEVHYWSNWHGVHYVDLGGTASDEDILWCGATEDIVAFADALNAMRYYSSGTILTDDTTAFADFQEKAKEWRALAVKPSLPEEARRFKIQAEDSFRNKDFEKAAEYYENALEIYPFWPDGYFNVALLHGEMGSYAQAVVNMKRYLELRPDAEDSQAARDRIYIWEGKITKTKQPPAPNSISPTHRNK